MLKLGQAFAGKVLQKLNITIVSQTELKFNICLQDKINIIYYIPAGPESKIALLAGERFLVCLEK